jgi:hypothetical protein
MNSKRRFPPPWSIEEYNDACFIVRDNNGQKLAYVYFEDARPAIGRQATHQRRGAKDCGEYRQIAGVIAGGTDVGRRALPPRMAKKRSPEFYSNRVMMGFGLISIVIALITVTARFW